MAKLTAQGYGQLDPDRYPLEVVDAEPINEYGPQLKVRLRVAKGVNEGFEFVDYPNRGAEDGVKVGTKAWDVFEVCLDSRQAPDGELDTEDLVGKRFEARVAVKKTGKGNRTEHGTIGPHRPGQEGPEDDELRSEGSGAEEDDLGDLPF